MSDTFDPEARSIVVRTRFIGPAQVVDATLALDTGATTTLISPSVLIAAGYDPSKANEKVFITSANGIVYLPKMPVTAIEALGIKQESLRVLVTTLPPSAGVDGLLGLDFLRGKHLSINFRKGLITLR